MSGYTGLDDPPSAQVPSSPHDPSTQTFSTVPLSPGLPSHRIAPDRQAYLPAQPISVRRRPSLRPSKERASFLDEILPTPSAFGDDVADGREGGRVLIKRSSAVGVLVIFIMVAIWMAATDTAGEVLGEGTRGLRSVFGSEGKEWAVQVSQSTAEEDGIDEEVMEGDVNTEKNGSPPAGYFDQYIMVHTIPTNMVELSGHGRRVIFIGDIHGSFKPLEKLMSRLSYTAQTDTLIHVGDLVTKGSHSIAVLNWMEKRNILGVRGNHDQPVVQWRAWMEWAGGDAWEGLVSELEAEEDVTEVEGRVEKMRKKWPKGWEWKGEHWHIAKKLSKRQYAYLLQLPLTLHIPSLHTHVVHAGLLPHNPLRDPDHPTQPLVATDRKSHSHSANTSTSDESSEFSRTSEEISILLDIPQNTKPWNLINMRGVHEKGKKKGRVTKSGKKGTPWSQVWKREMGRCTSDGAGLADQDEEITEEVSDRDDEEKREMEGEGENDPNAIAAALEAGGADELKLRKLRCSPVTVIYGHAAARGLDIKPYSKGIDTGCVYGRQLTALVLGETSGLSGKKVRVGEHRGVLVSMPCEKGGL